MEYQFWVSASTRIGEGQSSKVVNQLVTGRSEWGLFVGFFACLWPLLFSSRQDNFLWWARGAALEDFGDSELRVSGRPQTRMAEKWTNFKSLYPAKSVLGPKASFHLVQGGASHNQQLLDTGELILSNLQLSDAGNYSCQVDNGHGTDRISYHLVVQVPPSAPMLYVTSATSSSILLHWKSGKTGGAAISGFTLNYRWKFAKPGGLINCSSLFQKGAW